MDRLRRSIEVMSSSQRATLGLLAVLVLITTAVAVVTAASGVGDDSDLDAGDATSTTSPASSTTPSTTSTTVATTTTTSSTTTTTTTTPTRALLLRPDGIGDLYFGDPADGVLAALVAVLGDPDEDTGWVDQRQNYGVCLGDEVRFVRWETLQAFFTDGPSDWGPAGVRHFASYTQASIFEGGELDLETADGLSLGSPVGDVRAIYGEDAVYDDPVYGPVFFYDPPGAAQQWGSVTGLEPDDTIESITGSYACGE